MSEKIELTDEQLKEIIHELITKKYEITQESPISIGRDGEIITIPHSYVKSKVFWKGLRLETGSNTDSYHDPYVYLAFLSENQTKASRENHNYPCINCYKSGEIYDVYVGWSREQNMRIEKDNIDGIVEVLSLINEGENIIIIDDIQNEFAEGSLKERRSHIYRERNSKVKENAIKKYKNNNTNKKLACECCGFDYEKKYGDIGKDFIEMHHFKPVSTLKENDTTELEDVVLLCANCHRMIHRKKSWIGKKTDLPKLLNIEAP